MKENDDLSTRCGSNDNEQTAADLTDWAAV